MVLNLSRIPASGNRPLFKIKGNSNSYNAFSLFLIILLARQSEMPKFAESLLNNFIQKMPMQTNLVEHLINTKKLFLSEATFD